MPLYSLALMREQHERKKKRKLRVSDLEHAPSDIITVNHDGIHVETELHETIAWDQINMRIIGTMDCTNNPPFPRAHGGDTYIITAPGMFGTYEVEQGDMLLALSDTDESRDERYEKLWFHFSRSGGGGSMANIPVATQTVLGGIFSGNDIEVGSDGRVTVLDDSHNHSTETIKGLTEILSGKSDTNHKHQVKDITDFTDTLNAELSAFEESFNKPMTGATSITPGTSGMAPRPLAGDHIKFLRGDGTWAFPDTKTSLTDLGITATAPELSYSSGLTGNIQVQINDIHDALDLKANISHTHSYAASTTPGGSATTADKLNHVLHIKGKDGDIGSFDGGTATDIQITPENIGAAPTNHGNHVPTYSAMNNNQVLMIIDGSLAWGAGGTSEDDPVTYSVFTGTDGSGDGSVGLVPAPKSTDAKKFLCASGSWDTPASTTLDQMGIVATKDELNYVHGVTSSIQDQLNGKAPTSHTHNYAASDTAGGNAITANKVVNSLGIKLGSNEVTTYDGSEVKNVIITPDSIGAAPVNHGTHVDTSGATEGQIYTIGEDGTAEWKDPAASGLVGSAIEDHVMIFSGTDGSYKDSGKSISSTVSDTPSQNILLTEAGIAAYVEALLEKKNSSTNKSTVTMSSFQVTSGGDLMAFDSPVVLKKITLKVDTDISATGCKITRGEDTIFTIDDTNMVTGNVYDYDVYSHLDVSDEPLHITFDGYQAGSATLYLEYAYDTLRDLDTGESNIYMISRNLYNTSTDLHTFQSNGMIRAITINPIEEYNADTTVTIKVGEYTLYSQAIDLTTKTPKILRFYYPVTASISSKQNVTIELGNVTQGTSKVYFEYADEITMTTVLSDIGITTNKLNANSDRLDTILDSMQ